MTQIIYFLYVYTFTIKRVSLKLNPNTALSLCCVHIIHITDFQRKSTIQAKVQHKPIPQIHNCIDL